MAIKNYKPTTPSRRNMSVTDYSSLSKVAPEKSLLEPLNKKSGRNSYGRITVRHRGGGNRRKYRVIDFKRNKLDMPATVKTIEYDPNRSAHIALIQYEDGVKSYITAPEGLKVGDTVMAGPNADIVAGNALALKDMPVGTIVHNVELYPGNGAQHVQRSRNPAKIHLSLHSEVRCVSFLHIKNPLSYVPHQNRRFGNRVPDWFCESPSALPVDKSK